MSIDSKLGLQLVPENPKTQPKQRTTRPDPSTNLEVQVKPDPTRTWFPNRESELGNIIATVIISSVFTKIKQNKSHFSFGTDEDPFGIGDEDDDDRWDNFGRK